MAPFQSRALVVGGGVGALEAVLALRSLARDRVAITLVSDTDHFVYRPLSVGVPFDGASTVRLALGDFAEDVGSWHVRDRVTSVELDRHRIITEDTGPIGYDHLVLAMGAVQEPAVPGALTFRGPEDVARFRTALGALEDRDGGQVVFVARSATDWTLPLYELALLTSTWAARRELAIKVSLVTPEARPLEALGADTGEELRDLLERHQIDLYLRSIADRVVDGALEIPIEGRIPADLVVALPVLSGNPAPGLPHDDRGFVAVDDYCRIEGARDAYAVGDMTTNAPRQGGLAAQQADVAAACVAAAAGAHVAPEPYVPVLRAMLFTGEQPRFLRSGEGPAPGDGLHDHYSAAPWWPPHKIASRHLAPYLATHTELLEPVE